MSTNVYPSYGYLTRVTETVLKKLGLTWEVLAKQSELNKKELAAIDGLLDLFSTVAEYDTSFSVKIDGKKVWLEAIYISDDCYVCDGMDTGWYFYFEENELFKKETTDFAKVLKLKGIMPKMHAWAPCG